MVIQGFCYNSAGLRSPTTGMHHSAAKPMKFRKNYSMHPTPARLRHALQLLAMLMAFACCGAQAQTKVIAPPLPNNDYTQATQLYRAAQYDQAMARIDAWLKERPKDARGRFLKGMIYSQQRKNDEAARVYTELTQDFPELPEPYNNLAVIYAEIGRAHV